MARTTGRRRAPTGDRNARVIVIIGLVAATIGWLTWGSLESFLDPGRTGPNAHALADHPVIREDTQRDLEAAMVRAGAPAAGYTDANIRGAAHAALDDPALRRALIATLATTGRNRLSGGRPRPIPPDPAIAAAAARALRAERPDLGPLPLPWRFRPTAVERLPRLATLRSEAHVIVVPAVLLAIASLGTAIVVGSTDAVRRRFGIWALVAGCWWLLLKPVTYGLGEVLNGSRSVHASAVSASLGATVTIPSGMLALIGAVLALVSRPARSVPQVFDYVPSAPSVFKPRDRRR